jgi:hypothetical protein
MRGVMAATVMPVATIPAAGPDPAQPQVSSSLSQYR